MAVGWNLSKMLDNQNEIFCSISSGSNFDFKKLMEQRIKGLVLSCLYLKIGVTTRMSLFIFFFLRLWTNSTLIYKIFIERGKIRKLSSNYSSVQVRSGFKLRGQRGL